MMFIILLVFFYGAEGEFITTGLDTSLGSDYLKEIIGPIDENGCNEDSSKISNIAEQLGLGRTDEDAVTNEDNFVRPCPSFEMECIRQFLADNSDCQPVYDHVSEPLCLVQNTLYLSSANLSVTLNDVQIEGLSNYNVIEFYYNKVTKILIFAIEFDYLNQTSPNGCFSYKRPARESIVLCDCVNVYFENPILTAEIPIVPNLRLDLADIHFSSSKISSDLYIGPQAYTSKEPDVIKSFNAVSSNFPVIVLESTLYQSNLLMAYLIQKNICNFGVKLYSL